MSNGTTVTLEPGGSQEFKTNEGTYATLAVTNQNKAGIANFAAACNTAKPDPYDVSKELAANQHWSVLKDFGGGMLLVVNTTNPSNPSTIKVAYNAIAKVG